MNVAIVVAGGKGLRFGGDRPKQFFDLNGIPIIVHTLRRFEQSKEIEKVIVVLPANELSTFQSLTERFELSKILRAVAGGETRAQSVQNGIRAIEEADVVAVHDGVRPLVTAEEIDRVVAVAAENGAAILVAPVGDTIKEIKAERVAATLSRAGLCRALTPQCFRFDILKSAYTQLAQLEASSIEVTDDSMLVERLGLEVVAIPGSVRNIKITMQEDLVVAAAFLSP